MREKTFSAFSVLELTIDNLAIKQENNFYLLCPFLQIESGFLGYCVGMNSEIASSFSRKENCDQLRTGGVTACVLCIW